MGSGWSHRSHGKKLQKQDLQKQNSSQQNVYWLSAILSRALGLEISPAIYRILLRWWLGIPLAFPTESHDGSVDCPFCGDASDPFGDHALCCHKAEFYTRHQAIVKCLTAFVAAAGLRVANEVQIDGRERPADIFVNHWTTTDPVAVDVTVSHPLAPSLGLNLRMAKELAAAKEQQKIAKYARLIAEKQLHFIPSLPKGVRQWLVKWTGTDQQSWEPAESFVDVIAPWARYNRAHSIVVDCARIQ